MKLLQRIPVFRIFAKCFCCHHRCHLPSLAKRTSNFAEVNIIQYICLWNMFKNCSRRYHQASGNLWNHEALQKYLRNVSQEYQSIAQLLNDSSMNEYKRRDLSKRHTALFPLAVSIKEIQEAKKEMQDLEALCAKLNSSEEEALLELAIEEKGVIDQKIRDLYQKLFRILVPRDKYDECDVILEVTSGRTTGGGLHHAAAYISGDNVYRHLKYEGGIHRVQRIPEIGLSSRMQRIHTGTMSVIVLPQLEEINIKVDPRDLRIDTFRAKGAGGQHVNTTDSAVRIVHIPTGTTVECQQERSQQVNRERAMQALKEKLYQQAIERELSQKQSARKMQVVQSQKVCTAITNADVNRPPQKLIPIKLGTRSQSERMRTYNFSQDRVSDHRISYEVRDIKGILNGKGVLDELINKLLEAAEMESLTEYLENSFKSLQADS